MPAPDKAAAKARNPDRFYCPFPGCNRSFAELWRLKVHYRAPPDVRGSGKERGHGTELELCPKCGKDLKPGKHHVGCSAGRSAPRQHSKRAKTEGNGEAQGGGGGGIGAGSIATGQPVLGFPVNRDFFAYAGGNGGIYAVPPGRPGMGGNGAQLGVLPVPQPVPMVIPGPHPGISGLRQPSLPMSAACRFNGSTADNSDLLLMGQPQPYSNAEPFGDSSRLGGHDTAAALLGWPQQMAVPAAAGTSNPPDLAWPNNPAYGALPAGSNKQQAAPVSDAVGKPVSPPALVPSPPPLPPDWDAASRNTGLLFDFDMFNSNRPHEPASEATRPFITVTTAMNPADMICPSDDYIMQILFGDVNEAVPRRMTTHLHHFESMDDAAGSPFAEGEKDHASGSMDPLDALLSGGVSSQQQPVSSSAAPTDLPLAMQNGQQQAVAAAAQQDMAAAAQQDTAAAAQQAVAAAAQQQQHMGSVSAAAPAAVQQQQPQQLHSGHMPVGQQQLQSKQSALAASVAAGLPVDQQSAGVPMSIKHEQQTTLTVPH